MSLLIAYTGSADGQTQRMRNSRHGMDPALLSAINADPDDLTDQQEQLVRMAAARYSAAMRSIRDHATSGDYDACVTVAAHALASMPEDQIPRRGEQISSRMCQWMAADRFIDLARIVDASIADDDVPAMVDKRVARAFAGTSLR